MKMELSADVKEELSSLDSYQRNLVLGGLRVKLAHHARSGRVSYRYDVCPVCADIGSTEEDERCDQCYIRVSCKKPFTDGFRDDHEKGAAYFSAMERFLKEQERVVVVGGTADKDRGKESGIVRKLADLLDAESFNGVRVCALERLDLLNYAVVIWMPNIDNAERKFVPKKGRGAVLICSKVMREGYTRFDSVGRIFKMHGNAVIEVYPDDPACIEFALVDALGNEWIRTSKLEELSEAIERFVFWSRGQKRVSCRPTKRRRNDRRPRELEVLAELTRTVADKVETERGGRYFGNASTRCMAMFPSARMMNNIGLYASPRNTDKKRINVDDFVFAEMGSDGIEYLGDRKPSVDTPVQAILYAYHPKVRFMIHGHAFIKGAPGTKEYYPCGDLREVDEVSLLMDSNGPNGAINLAGHGFLIYAEDEKMLREMVEEACFINVVPLPGVLELKSVEAKSRT